MKLSGPDIKESKCALDDERRRWSNKIAFNKNIYIKPQWEWGAFLAKCLFGSPFPQRFAVALVRLTPIIGN
jgi:hypothetical protein